MRLARRDIPLDDVMFCAQVVESLKKNEMTELYRTTDTRWVGRLVWAIAGIAPSKPSTPLFTDDWATLTVRFLSGIVDQTHLAYAFRKAYETMGIDGMDRGLRDRIRLMREWNLAVKPLVVEYMATKEVRDILNLPLLSEKLQPVPHRKIGLVRWSAYKLLDLANR